MRGALVIPREAFDQVVWADHDDVPTDYFAFVTLDSVLWYGL